MTTGATPARWLSRSIASRITAATALLIAGLVLLLAALAFGNARSLLLRNVDDALASDARQVNDRLSLTATSLEASAAALAANAMVVNALLDSAGRSTYLQPFLRDMALPGKVQGTVTLTDHRGTALASNAAGPAPGYAAAPWLDALIGERRAVARLSSGVRPTLLLAFPVVFPSTQSAEGALVFEVDLGRMFGEAVASLPAGVSAALRSGERVLAAHGSEARPAAAGDAVVSARVSLDTGGAIGALGLALDVSVPKSSALAGIDTLTRDVVAAGLAVLLLASGLAWLGVRRLLRPLRQLSDVAERIRREQRFDLQLPASGSDEIGTMAASFNHMMNSVRQAQQNLEAEVAARTAALENTRARLDAVQRQMNDGLLVVDSHGCIESFSGGAERLFGRTPAEVLGRGVAVIIPSWQAVRAEAALDISEHGRFQRKIRALRGGEGFVAEISVSLMVFDKLPQWVLLVRDVTQQQDAEQRLRDTNLQLEDSVAQLRRHDEDMAQVNRMNELLVSCQSSPEAHMVIERALCALFAGHGGALAVLRGVGGLLDTVARWGDAEVCLPSFALGDCWGLRLGRPHDTHDIAAPSCQHGCGSARAGVCLPLSVQGETLGLLMLNAAPEAAAEERHRVQHLLEIVGEAIKFGLFNLKLREALHTAALRDALTGLFNRRYLEETLPRELERGARSGKPIALAVIDLDHFKRFNDGYGHEAGDLVLKETARLLGESLRGSDIACRLGGEELVAVLHDASAANAAIRLDSFRAALARLALNYRGAALPPVTVSVGVAQAPAHGATMSDLLRAADEALYLAKAQGRDRTVIAREAVVLQAVGG